MTDTNALRCMADEKWQTRRTGGLKEVNENPDDWTVTQMGWIDGRYGALLHSARGDRDEFCAAGYAEGQRAVLTEAFRAVITDRNGVLVGRRRNEAGEGFAPVEYRCDGKVMWRHLPDSHFDAPAAQPRATWLAARYMPLWAARPGSGRVITRVRCERVQDISEADAKAEGVVATEVYGEREPGARITHLPPRLDYRASFRKTWNSIHGAGAWDRNEWVFPYDFEREEKTDA